MLESDIVVESTVVSKTLGLVQEGDFVRYTDLQGSSYVVLIMDCDESVIARLLEADLPEPGTVARKQQQITITSALKEAMKTVGGKLLPTLQAGSELLTVCPPKSVFGSIDLPKYFMHTTSLETNYGLIKFSACCDKTQTKVMKKLAETEELSKAKVSSLPT